MAAPLSPNHCCRQGCTSTAAPSATAMVADPVPHSLSSADRRALISFTLCARLASSFPIVAVASLGGSCAGGSNAAADGPDAHGANVKDGAGAGSYPVAVPGDAAHGSAVTPAPSVDSVSPDPSRCSAHQWHSFFPSLTCFLSYLFCSSLHRWLFSDQRLQLSQPGHWQAG